MSTQEHTLATHTNMGGNQHIRQQRHNQLRGPNAGQLRRRHTRTEQPTQPQKHPTHTHTQNNATMARTQSTTQHTSTMPIPRTQTEGPKTAPWLIKSHISYDWGLWEGAAPEVRSCYLGNQRSASHQPGSILPYLMGAKASGELSNW